MAAQEQGADQDSAAEMQNRRLVEGSGAAWAAAVETAGAAEAIAEVTARETAKVEVDATAGELVDLSGGSRTWGPRYKQACRLNPMMGAYPLSRPAPIAKIWSDKLSGCAHSLTKSRNASTAPSKNNTRSCWHPAADGKGHAIRI